MSLCRINLFCFVFILFFFHKKTTWLKKKKEKKKQIKCGGDVPKTILESGVVVLYFVVNSLINRLWTHQDVDHVVASI